jgi:aspartate carbamoyltransferase regulatory subunit
MNKKIIKNQGEPPKSIKVSALRQGTVVDHLKKGTGIRAIQVLGLQYESGTVTIGLNLESQTYGSKDLIKIENKELTKAEINKIALLSPDATFSIIRDYQVVEKRFPELPDTIEGLVKCNNPACVTNAYSDVTKKFSVIQKKPVKLRCFFCERCITEKEIVLL